MDDLVKEFIGETVESLGELDIDLVRLEQDHTNKELLSKVFRLMHTIKGTCGFIGLVRLEKTAHAAENLLDNFRSGRMDVSETAMTLLFMCIDRVRYLVTEVHKAGKEPDGNDSDIIQAIEDVIASALGGENHNAEKAAALQHSEPPISSAPELPEIAATQNNTAPAQSGMSEISAAGNPGNSAPANSEYLRVQMSVLEELINMVSELVLTRNQLLQLVRAEDGSTLKTPLQRLNRIVSDLQDNVMKTRMQPIGNAWSKLPRIVRDIATEKKKKIALEMEGEDTELDRQVLEMIKDPLIHMIRNSCDHGIELPQERIAAGKRDQGTINLKAYHEGGFIILKIIDDGKGLDPKKIAAKAVEKNLIEPDKISTLNDKQILNFIMRPGFSTAESVTNISGRGVGMDVVRANIEKIGGSIDMESSVGKGTSFTIQIPLTLAIISALIVEIENHRYAIPQMNIQELVSLGVPGENELVEFINGKPVLRLRDRIIPLLNSATLFNLAEKAADYYKEKLIAVMSTGSSYYGIIVDRIYDTEEVVIKSVSPLLKSANIFSGNTILGDGQVIMILDPAAIARKFNIEREVNNFSPAKEKGDLDKKIATERAAMLVFKAGEGTVKAVPLALVSRIHAFNRADITHSGQKIMVQFNDSLIQLCFIDNSQALHDKEVMTLVLSDDRSNSSLGLIIDHVIDIIEGDLDISTSTSRPGILGSMILDEKIVDVIDISYFLMNDSSDWFSLRGHTGNAFPNAHIAHSAPAVYTASNDVSNGSYSTTRTLSSKRKPSLLLVDDSPFFRSILHPVLVGAGYDVTVSVDALNAIKLHDEGMMFDVILSDIEMPGMDGYEFVEKMRHNSQWQKTPFIAITSHNTQNDAEYGYKKGFDKYIGKFNKDELIQTLESVRA